MLLSTEVWVFALIRRAELAGATRGDGERVWMQPAPSTAEADLDVYVERAARIDPDLWVVEIEDTDGARFLTEPVENT